MGNNFLFFNKKKSTLVLQDSELSQTAAVERHNTDQQSHQYLLTQLSKCVKNNESPTLNAGDEYKFNFVAGTQRAKLELTNSLGFELKNEITGAEINLRSYGDVEIQAPSTASLYMRQKGANGARVDLGNGDVSVSSASGGEIEIKQRQGSAIKIGATGDISLEPTAGHVVFSDGNPVITTKDKATTSALGVVKVDGTTITANNGVISASIDNELSMDSNKPVANSVITKALDERAPEEWQKPTDWVDIRSGALPNSVYVLVGHSADYSLYPKFSVRAEISNSGSYDVYIDGVKYATTANNTETDINWETLALQTGRSTTYPISLVTHIVRVTPTSSSETISYITFRKATTDTGNKALGLLWAHFNISNAIKINQNLFQYSGSYNPYLVAVTAQNDLLKNSGGVIGGLISESSDYAQYSSQYIQHLPKFEATENADVGFGHRGTEYTNITKLVFSGDKNYRLVNYSFDSCYQLKEIQVPSMTIQSNGAARFAFRKSYALKKLPSINFTTATNLQDFLTEAYSLEPTFLDLTSATLLTKLGIYGTSENRIDGLKGLVVSNSAPFSNATSPQINISYTGLNRQALIALFNSLPTVTNSQVCNITGATGAADLTASDLSIATGKGWTITR